MDTTDGPESLLISPFDIVLREFYGSIYSKNRLILAAAWTASNDW